VFDLGVEIFVGRQFPNPVLVKFGTRSASNLTFTKSERYARFLIQHRQSDNNIVGGHIRTLLSQDGPFNGKVSSASDGSKR